MIKSFGTKDARKIFKGVKVKSLPVEYQHAVRLKLRMLNSSPDLKEFMYSGLLTPQKVPVEPGSLCSISVNRELNIIFKWDGNGANEVSIAGNKDEKNEKADQYPSG